MLRATSAGPLRAALIGYGAGGEYFHAPFIAAAEGIELSSIVTRSPLRRARAAAAFPAVVLLDDLAAALATRPDVVVLTTPPESRRQLVLEALSAGVAVVADKPFAPDAATASELRDAAATAGVPLAVFHNRRWDADIRTARKVLRSGALGAVQRFSSRFDLDDPGTLEATAGGGLLRDLGSHLVDQAIWLFGAVETVHAELDFIRLDGVEVDSGFTVDLRHRSGVLSHLSASKVNRAEQRELRLLGTEGSYRSDGTDVQAQAVFAGRRPVTERRWGIEAEERWGTLRTGVGSRRVPSERGAYQDFYSALARALRDGAPLPVTADEAVKVVRVLDAARTSARERQIVELTG